ncbi:hypothetical protein EKI60_03050 [Candidatus Saccharibacteria bacterium]|nr:MAG: hypothetical protein EKI60_03050 [Candidatus Saccharibacteria bacterium]
MTKNEAQYIGVVLEEIRDQNKIVLEAVGDLQTTVRKLDHMETDLKAIKSDIKAIKAAVTDTSKQVQNHERRITKLEHAR